MKIINKKKALEKDLSALKKSGKKIGFVPTMGALHQGHISLAKQSVSENDITVASIFVNPTQFNNLEDLKKYPRDTENDLKKMKTSGVDFVFLPSGHEIYPKKDERIFDFKGMESVMEGEFRPGHFNGVAQVVSKLFEIVKPDRAYFGKKDFQQLAIINYLTENYMSEYDIQIIPCEIVRESDGLAMSSRNLRLTKEQRKAAPLISQTLKKYSKLTEKYSVEEISEKIVSEINKNSYLKTEYFEIVDNKSLQKAEKIIKGKVTACIAVFAGDVRLIDNFAF